MMATKSSHESQTKFVLDEKDIPTKWYKIQADFKTPLPPPLHPGTGQPIGPQDLAPLFPVELIRQGGCPQRWTESPAKVRAVSPLGPAGPARRRRGRRGGAEVHA